jgi:hypothetical protein
MSTFAQHVADVVVYALLLMSLTAGVALIVLLAWTVGHGVASLARRRREARR